MWEYTTVTFNSLFDSEKSLKEKSDRVLEQHGKEGWELVNFQCVGGLITLVFSVVLYFRDRKRTE